MLLASWVRAVLHQRITAPGGFGGQCVDAANDYIRAVYGMAPVRANAIDWFRRGVPGFTLVANEPANYPPAGALSVWGPDVRAGTNEFGHIAVALVADPATLVSVDQNWDGLQQCQVVPHSYAGVLGWLIHRPQ